jgi:integrase
MLMADDNKTLVTWVTETELAALLAAPDRTTWTGRRDHALILLAAQTGLRISEFTGLTTSDIHLGAGHTSPVTAKAAKTGSPAHGSRPGHWHLHRIVLRWRRG